MYNVTDRYLQYSTSTTRYVHLRGNITKAGKQTPIEMRDVVTGTPVITRKAVSENNFNIGNVYVDEIEVKLGKSSESDWKSINTAELFFEVGVELGTQDDIEWVPLGYWDIPSDGVTYEERVVTLKADSRMSRFDKELGISVTSGTPYQILNWCCINCNMELEQTRDELSVFPNNGEVLILDENSGCETYRDVVMWCVQALGCFATISRGGKLEVRRFTTSPRYELNPDTLRKITYGDTIINIANVTMKIGNELIASEPTVVQEKTLSLEANPLLQSNTVPEVMKNRITAIADELKNVNYTPVKLEFNGDACLDIGDNFTVKGRPEKLCITAYTWKFMGVSSIEGVPFSNKKSKEQSSKTSSTSSVGSGGTSGNFSLVRFENPDIIEVGGIRKDDFLLKFELPANGIPLLNVSIIMEVLTEGVFEVVLRYDDVDIYFKPKELYTVGMHTFSFSYHLEPVDVQMGHILVGYVISSDGGTARIEARNLVASVTGFGLNTGIEDWDGRLAFEERIPKQDIEWLRDLSIKVTENLDVV